MKRFSIFLILFSMLSVSCRFTFGKRIHGNGNIKTETRTTGQFNSVDVSGNINVYVRQDSLTSVKIEADENLLEYIHITVDGSKLDIREEDGYNLSSAKGIKVYVSGPSFKQFESSGACDIFSENQIKSSEPVTIKLSGSCDVNMDISAPKIEVDLSGAGTIVLKGETKDFNVDGSGSTNVKCFDLMTENTDIEMSGAGDAEVFASVKLSVHVSGAADVKYKGNAVVNQEVSGAGSVKKVETAAPHTVE
jgi:hypothetical protein